MKLVRSRYGNCLTRTVSILDRRGIRTNLTIVEMKLPIIRVKIKLYREKFSKLASLFKVQIFLSRPSYEVNIYEAALSTLLSLVQISLLVQGEPKSGPHQYLQRSIRNTSWGRGTIIAAVVTSIDTTRSLLKIGFSRDFVYATIYRRIGQITRATTR